MNVKILQLIAVDM